MIPLIAPLGLVETYSENFKSHFNEDTYESFKRYLSGLMINENKTIEGINRMFVLDIQHQSHLNRFLTTHCFDERALNKSRVKWLQSVEQTAFKEKEGAKGTLIIDDTLLNHYGSHFEQCSMLYDHVTKTSHWAHNLVNLHYSDDQTDYPVDYRLWEPPDLDAIVKALQKIGFTINAAKEAAKTAEPIKWRTYLLREYHKKRLRPYKGGPKSGKGVETRSTEPIEVVYKSKLDYAKDLLRDFYTDYPDSHLPIAFDHWYTSADFCEFIGKKLEKSYVGTLAEQDVIVLHTQKDGKDETESITCGAFVQRLIAQHQQAVKQKLPPVFEKVGIHFKGKKEVYYAYCRKHDIQNLGQQQLVISLSKADLSDKEPKFYVSNRLNWRSGGILRIRRHRWPIEVYHEEGKAEGLNKYQVRQFDALKKHIACVCLTYSMLKRLQFDHDLLNKFQWKPKREVFTLPFLRRVMSANALIDLIDWFVQQIRSDVDRQILIDKITKAYA